MCFFFSKSEEKRSLIHPKLTEILKILSVFCFLRHQSNEKVIETTNFDNFQTKMISDIHQMEFLSTYLKLLF